MTYNFGLGVVFIVQLMKKHFAVLVACFAVVSVGFAGSYVTEATITPSKAKGQYEVVARISKLIQKEGKIVEEVVSRPRVLAPLGEAASLYVGLDSSNAKYLQEENVSMDVSLPEAGKSGFAECMVTVKRGDTVVSRSKMRVKIEEERN